jgi:hypothetical protein
MLNILPFSKFEGWREAQIENLATISADASLKRELYAVEVPGKGTWEPEPEMRA